MPHVEGARYYDIGNGTEIQLLIGGDDARLSGAMEGRGFGAFLADTTGEDMGDILATMRARADRPLASVSAAWTSARQEMVPVEPTRRHGTAPDGMIAIPACDFDFQVTGVVIDGYANDGVDGQYP